MPTTRQWTVDDLHARVRPRRELHGCSAVLLPFTRDGAIDWSGFARLLERTVRAGLTPAVNMDTGFGPQLSPGERTAVLRRVVEVMGAGEGLDADADADVRAGAGVGVGAGTGTGLGLDAGAGVGMRFIAGAGTFGASGDPLAAYRAAVDEIVGFGGTPIIFQSDWLSAQRDADLAAAYRAIIGDAPAAIGFELGTMFAPFGRIYSLEEYRRLLDVEPLVGAKHSSLDRFAELDRLALRDEYRPGFRVYTGNDLAIDMIMYGSDYLLGLSTYDPEAFAQRDRWWAEGDARWLPLNDALQAVGMVGFRDPVPAYKHSAAEYLGLTGDLDDPHVHPSCPRRPAGERDLLRPLAALVAAAQPPKSP